MSMNKAIHQVIMHEQIGGNKQAPSQPTKPVKMPEAPRPAGPKAKSTTGVNVPDTGGAEVTPPQGLGENKYLSQVSKNQIIEVLEEEYKKILISETVSKSDTSVLKKKQIKEFINYLQTNENITYANLAELHESWLDYIPSWKTGAKVAGTIGKIGKKVVGKFFPPVGIALDGYDYATGAYDLYKHFKDIYDNPSQPPPNIPTPNGGEIEPSSIPLPGMGQVFGGFQENSQKQFWKNRLIEKINNTSSN